MILFITLLGTLVLFEGIWQSDACPQAPWAPEFGLNSREDEIEPFSPCSDFKTRFSCRYRNFCCFEDNKCIPANAMFIECTSLTTEATCQSRGCFWTGDRCRRNCPFTMDPSLLCNVLGQIYVPPTGAPTRRPTLTPTTLSPTNYPTMPNTSHPTLKPSLSPLSSAPTRSPTTSSPTLQPTSLPTKSPQVSSPTLSPTFKPSRSPTLQPRKPPSKGPTIRTTKPSKSPITSSPSKSPTVKPTKAPISSSPTLEPTALGSTRRPVTSSPTSLSPASRSPTKQSTDKPTLNPTNPTKSPTIVTKKPTAVPTLKPTSEPTTASPTREPTNMVITRFPTAKPVSQRPTKAVPTKPHTLSPTKIPTKEPTRKLVGWSALIPRGGTEFRPNRPCSSFTSERSCQLENFCCWDQAKQNCFGPTRTMHDLECVNVSDQETCDRVFEKDCTWREGTCRRKEPPVTEETTPDSICAIVQQSRDQDVVQRGENNQYCWVKELSEPCVFPFIVNGVRFEECASFKDHPPEAGRGLTTSKSTSTWCPVIPNSKVKAVNGWGFCTCTPKKRPRSVLLFIADDLRTDLSAGYGRKEAKTPFLDELVMRDGSVVFDRSYSNYPLCGPSRDSFLSGLLPDMTAIYNFGGEGLRQDHEFRSRIKTIPELFKDAGYYTLGGGKVFHLGHQDPKSWSEYFMENVEQNNDCGKDKLAIKLKTKAGKEVSQACRTTASLDTLVDYRVANSASKALQRVVMNQQEPFFMVAGFYKPHTPYHVHNRFWNQFILYGTPDAERVQGPQQQASYTNPELTFNMDSDILYDWGTTPWQKKNADFRKIMRTGYLAALAQTDDAMGRVLLKLEELKLEKSTLVAFVSDHGYFLGENNLFAKHNNFELSVRVPTFFHIPWLTPPRTPIEFPSDPSSVTDVVQGDDGMMMLNARAKKTAKKSKPSLPMIPSSFDENWASYVLPRSKRTKHFFELVDLFPTLVSLMGLEMTKVHNGTDQSKVILSTALRGHASDLTPSRTAALSQVNRCSAAECSRTPNRMLYAAGYTVRTDDWRYTVFVHAPSGVPLWNSSIITSELYSHVKDDTSIFAYEAGTNYDTEFLNVAAQNPKICAELLLQIKHRFGGLVDV